MGPKRTVNKPLWARALQNLSKREKRTSWSSQWNPSMMLFRYSYGKALQERLLYHSQHPAEVPHPGQRLMKESMQRELVSAHIAKDVHTTVSSCRTCARNDTSPKWKKQLQLCPARGLLEFVAINISGSLLRSLNGNQYVIDMNNI